MHTEKSRNTEIHLIEIQKDYVWFRISRLLKTLSKQPAINVQRRRTLFMPCEAQTNCWSCEVSKIMRSTRTKPRDHNDVHSHIPVLSLRIRKARNPIILTPSLCVPYTNAFIYLKHNSIVRNLADIITSYTLVLVSS